MNCDKCNAPVKFALPFGVGDDPLYSRPKYIYGLYEHCIGDEGFISGYFSSEMQAKIYLGMNGYKQVGDNSFGNKHEKMTAKILFIELDELTN